MKKYLIEPYAEQTYSLAIGQNSSNTVSITRGVLYSDTSSDQNILDNNVSLLGGIDLNLNDRDTPNVQTVLLNGKLEETTTSIRKNNNGAVFAPGYTPPLYPQGLSDKNPTTISYKIAPTLPPITVPMENDNSLLYFIIAIVIIFIILIILYFFVL
jgi:hypothetical protein